MRFMRFGPSIIFLRTAHGEAVKKVIEEIFSVNEIPTDEAIRKSREFETVLFVTDEWIKKTLPPKTGFLIKHGAPYVISTVINRNLPVEKVHVESTLIFLRVPEKVDEALSFIAKKYGGKVTTLRDALDEGEAGDTVVGVTKKRLSSPIGPEEIEGAVLIRRGFLQVYRELSIDAPCYSSSSSPSGTSSPSRYTTPTNATKRTSLGS